MKYCVIVSERAARNLNEQVCFLAKVNRDAARRLKDRLLAEIRTLREFPHRYPYFNEPFVPANKYHKLYVENWYLILYQIQDDTVYVDHVLDCRRDYQWLLK